MMREIKFRAWDKEDEEMHKDVTPMCRDGELENIIFDYENAGYNFIDIEIKYCDTVFLYEDNPYIIMQYTGLKDINGVEIYEGDIVEWLDRNFDAVFGNSDGPDWFHRTKLIKFIDQGFNVPQGTIRELKVIGNIYENPELLGDSQ